MKLANSVVDFFEVPLSGPIYDEAHGKLMLEVRDFGEKRRTLAIRTMIDGMPVSTMVRWDEFIDGLDAMRARMMPGDWDDALSQLIGGTTLDSNN